MKISDPILFDTNVLVYNQDQDSDFYKQASLWHQKVLSGEIKAVLSSQNLAEFAAVMASPKKIVKPMVPKLIGVQIEEYLSLPESFRIVYPNGESMKYFNKFVAEFPRTGDPKRIFDLFLVATMLGNNIKRILTANAKDFVSFPQIEVVAL